MTVTEPPTGGDADHWVDTSEHVDRQGVVEQATGMLMFVYGINDEDAFDILRFHSQEHHIKVRLIAEQIVKDMVQLSASKGQARTVQFDGLMLTAHNRITAVASRQQSWQSKTGSDTGER